MRKKSLSLAVALAAGAVVMAPGAAVAGDLSYTLYGQIRISLDAGDDQDAELNNRTSAFGIKGGKKLGDGNSQVIFKLEWQVDPTNRSRDRALIDRDQWVGFKGDFGKIIAGTASSNYKQKGGKIDSMYRSALEGRGFLNIQSVRLHKGAGENRGRLTNMFQYTTPKFGNMEIVANTTFSGNSGNESIGFGGRYKTKSTLAYIDYFDDGPRGGSAVKIGGYHKMGALKVGLQLEDASDVDGYNFWFFNGKYSVNKKNWLSLTLGQADGKAGRADNTSWAVMWGRKMAKKTTLYVGYGEKNVDRGGNDVNGATFGIVHKF